MNPQLTLLLDSNTKAKSLFMSSVGMMLAAMEEVQGMSDTKKDPDLREKVTEALGEILQAVRPDANSWTYVKHQISYSVYLNARRQSGTITEYDLIRPGLLQGHFDNQFEYFEHYDRIRRHEQAMQEIGASGMKACNKCGVAKPQSAYRKGGTCNACRGKEYRNRKKDRQEGTEE